MPKPGRVNVSLGRTNAAILLGNEDLSLWSDEELLRGQKRSKNGVWTGRPPKVVPTAIHAELTKRRFGEVHELLRESLVDATKVLLSIIEDPDASDKDRLTAIGMLYDRVLGKPKERVEVDLVPKEPELWEKAVVDAIVWDTEEPVIEANAIEAGRRRPENGWDHDD